MEGYLLSFELSVYAECVRVGRENIGKGSSISQVVGKGSVHLQVLFPSNRRHRRECSPFCRRDLETTFSSSCSLAFQRSLTV